jgi:hypothetical protein
MLEMVCWGSFEKYPITGNWRERIIRGQDWARVDRRRNANFIDGRSFRSDVRADRKCLHERLHGGQLPRTHRCHYYLQTGLRPAELLRK